MYVAHAVYLGAVIYICGVCTTCLVGSGMSCVLLWSGAMVYEYSGEVVCAAILCCG